MPASEIEITPDSIDISSMETPEVSVVFPCLNEEETIGLCIEKALWAFDKFELRGEIVVADNGSTDRSVEICESYGVRVVHQPKRGYGNAYLRGMDAARGQYLVIADSDDTYDLRELGGIVVQLRQGADLVMGNRFKGKILPGAMTWSHRYIGNPVLSALLKVMFSTDVGDSHCGMRGLTQKAYRRLSLRAPGMEFASEMVINAAKLKLRIVEVPVTYFPRLGSSKLRTMRDGWRHLRYMLLRSPTHLFLLPGLVILLLGLAALLPFLMGPVSLGGRLFDIHAMFFIGMCTLVGYQILSLGLYARVVAVRERVDVEDAWLRWFRSNFRLELGLLLGAFLTVGGGAIGWTVLARWLGTDFGALSLGDTRAAFFALIGITLGVQTVFSSFCLLAIMGLHADEEEHAAADPR